MEDNRPKLTLTTAEYDALLIQYGQSNPHYDYNITIVHNKELIDVFYIDGASNSEGADMVPMIRIKNNPAPIPYGKAKGGSFKQKARKGKR